MKHILTLLLVLPMLAFGDVVRISELPAASTPSDSDVSLLVQGGTTKKVTIAQILTNAARTDGSYANPSWITALAWSKVTGVPSTAALLGLTNGSTIDAWGAKTVPSGTVVGTTDSQALTNKTYNGLTITTTTGTLTVSGSGGTLPTNSLAYVASTAVATAAQGATADALALRVVGGGTVAITGAASMSGTTSGSHTGTSSGVNTGDNIAGNAITIVSSTISVSTGTGAGQVLSGSNVSSGAYIEAGQNASQFIGSFSGLNWWRASTVSGTSGATVNSWAPVSGTITLSGTATKSTLTPLPGRPSGRPALSFNATNQSFTIPANTLTVSGSTTGYTMFAVVESDTANVLRPWWYQSNNDYQSAHSAGGYFCGSGGNTYYAPCNVAQTHVLIISSGTVNDFYIDGISHRSASLGATGYTFSSTIPVSIGKKSDGSLWWLGKIAELGYIPRAITAGEARTITESFSYYLQDYQNMPNLTLLGDSNADGSVAGLTACWPYLVSGSLGANWNYVNNSIGGETASATSSAFTQKYGWQYSNQRKVNLVPVALGTNDIALLGSNAATLEANLLALWQKVAEKGGYPIAVTIPPSTLSNVNTVRAVVNPWIRSNYPTYCYGCIDPDANGTIGPDAAASNSTWYTDGTHYSGTSQVIMASLALPVVQSAFNAATYGTYIPLPSVATSGTLALCVTPMMIQWSGTADTSVTVFSGGTTGKVVPLINTGTNTLTFTTTGAILAKSGTVTVPPGAAATITNTGTLWYVSQ